MIDIMEMLNSRLPIFNFFHQKLIEKYKIEKFTGHWNESFYVYVFVSSLIYILLIIYSFYLLYICLKEQKTKGSGVTYVNGFCDVIFACFCMPCYIVYRGFLNPCKTTQTERVIKETVIVAQPGVGVAQPGVGVAQPGVAQPTTTNSSGRVIAQPVLPGAEVIKSKPSQRVSKGGNSKYKIKLSNKVNI